MVNIYVYIEFYLILKNGLDISMFAVNEQKMYLVQNAKLVFDGQSTICF
jgi:hypothetical protein